MSGQAQTTDKPQSSGHPVIRSSGHPVIQSSLQLAILVGLALALRLLFWRWHEQQPLSGDEQEYFNQALTLLRERRYVELNLMRPPLYTGFLAACGYLFDTFVQRFRLVQAVIGALTVVPVWLLTRRLFDARAALLAGVFVALDATLASAATELLTETLFVFGLAWALWLLVLAGDVIGGNAHSAGAAGGGPKHSRGVISGSASTHWRRMLRPYGSVALAGVVIGVLALLRSVALPLLALGALLLLWRTRRLWPALLLLGCAALVIAPWTVRNYARYGALILIDTTGAENLWLDNNPAGATAADPLGREAAKRALYALGEDRAARQRLATEQGRAAILGNPGWFLDKAWGEAKKLVALQFFDDLRERRAIWVPPAEVWLRLLLGDGLWLVVAGAGLAGVVRSLKAKGQNRQTEDRSLKVKGQSRRLGLSTFNFQLSTFLTFQLSTFNLFWCGYIALTMIIFHVELRYRLPMYPALWPFAAAALLGGLDALRARATTRRPAIHPAARTGDQPATSARQPPFARGARGSALLGGVLAGALLLLPLALAHLHRPYLPESWTLARKHWALWQAERALAQGDPNGARAAALTALALDPQTALGRVALSRAALLSGDLINARAPLDAAIQQLPDHPYAHLLRGALRREAGDLSGARRDLAYERASREDLQTWASNVFAPLGLRAGSLQLGDGLDLGYIRGFAAALGPNDAPGYRWTTAQSAIRLLAPTDATTLRLRLASGRPASAPAPDVTVLVNGAVAGVVRPGAAWQDFALPLGAARGPITITLRSATFTPRQFDPASPDGRTLGVQVQSVSAGQP